MSGFESYPPWLLYFMIIMGGFGIAVFTLTALIWLYRGISELVNRIRMIYIRKHRFDKPPLAKCYCRDCEYWRPQTNQCTRNYLGILMAANWFCYDATPLKTERTICERACEFKKYDK